METPLQRMELLIGENNLEILKFLLMVIPLHPAI